MRIRKCSKCKRYTLKEKCPVCKGETKTAHPPKFSIEKEKKYGKYRRLGAAAQKENIKK